MVRDLQTGLLNQKKEIFVKNPLSLMKSAKKNNIEHRLTKPNTPKTNGRIERVNGMELLTLPGQKVKRKKLTFV